MDIIPQSVFFLNPPSMAFFISSAFAPSSIPLRTSTVCSLSAAKSPAPSAIIWFKQDLRLHDHPGLLRASAHPSLFPLYVFDRRILSRYSDEMLEIVLFALEDLRKSLKEQGSNLMIRFGGAENVIRDLVEEVKATEVLAEEEVEYHLRSTMEVVEYALANSTQYKSNLRIQSQNSTTESDSADQPPTPSKSSAPGLGFGPSSTASKPTPSTVTTKKKPKGKRDRASIIRRSPVQKPAFVSQQEEGKATEQNKNESAFLLTWLGLGGIILVEGILLAASGFLPDEWDKFFMKYLYPAFTPTVFFFVAGTVTYGVLKYLQNENLKDQK